MIKKQLNILIKHNWQPLVPLAAILLLWHFTGVSGFIPSYLLPGPGQVLAAFVADFPLLMRHLQRTLLEATVGLLMAAAASVVLAIAMDTNRLLNRSLSPLLLLTQTMPTVAVAPLLILWMGYGIAPKIALVFLVCFFPMTIGLLGAFAQTDEDTVRLLRSMGASRRQIYRYIKLPGSLPAFFSGLKIAGAYSIVGAVIAEWLGGDAGLGVYMIRVRRSYSFDKMFAVILLTSVLSIALVKLLGILERTAMPWKKKSKE